MPKLTEQLAAPLRQMQVRRRQTTLTLLLIGESVNWVETRMLSFLSCSGMCEANRQGFRRRQAGGGRGDLSKPVQTPPDGCGVRLG